MSLLRALAASGALEPLDLALARLLERRAGDEDADVIAVSAALLSHERRRGHACTDPSEWAGRRFPGDAARPLPRLPGLDRWRAVLASSPLVGAGDAPTPLVLDERGRLYLRRYWRAERRVARRLRRRLEAPPREVAAAALRPLFERLFPRAGGDEVDGQAVAAAAALRAGVAIVSGGPGTGKTTTVARILTLLRAHDPDLRAALAAPTGKAAARLGEALGGTDRSAELDVGGLAPSLRPSTTGTGGPDLSASTLHRLLGYDPRRDRFRHRAKRPLAVDLLVIDEASMVDLLMIDAVLDALPPRARLILLGDRDQLASVEAGSVFGDLTAAAGLDRPHSDDFAAFYRALGGGALPAVPDPEPPWRDAAVELRTGFRFRDRPGIAELASAIRRRDGEAALAVLADPARPEVALRDPAEPPLAPLETPLEDYLAAPTPADALDRLERFRLLCARRRGPWGVEGLNVAVERRLAERGVAVSERRYRGRPILVTANDYGVGLYNGDLGVLWPDDAGAGRLYAFFRDPGGGLRRLPLARLPLHETAWAMTVHKAQGSEFDRVVLVLGEDDSPLLTRELVYTGVTRARREVVVVATPERLRAAIARAGRRASGLADALRAAPAPEPAARARPEPEPAAAPRQLPLFGG